MLPKWGRGAVSPLVPSPSRSRMYPTSADLKMCRTRASPSSVRERAQWCAHDLEWVRGLREGPLTPCRRWQHRAALSRKGSEPYRVHENFRHKINELNKPELRTIL